MELNFAIICENAFIDEGKRLTIIQTFNRIQADNFPAVHSRLTVVTNYALREEERNKKHAQLIKIFNPSDQQIAELETPTKKEKQEKEMQFIAYFYNLPLKEKGTHKIKIYLDGNPQKELDLEVIPKNS